MFLASIRSFGPRVAAGLLASVFAAASLTAQVPLGTGTYTQDFNTTTAALPPGWLISEAGANANGVIVTGTGSSNAGDTYFLGTAGEWALGGLQSGNLIPTVGVAFTNTTGSTITGLTISYTGETWRVGTASRSDRLDFQYSVNATSLTTGTWTDFNSLDYANPGQATGSGTLQHSAVLTDTITGLSIPDGGTIYLRWSSFDASGADDALGVDNFSATAVTSAAPVAPTITQSPVAQTVTVGAIVTFTGAATGTAPIAYQWRKDTIPLGDGGTVSGAQTATLTLTGVTAADVGSYDFVATNGVDSVTSSAATLVVNNPLVAPGITTQPTPQTAPVGGSATFTVAATGTAPLTYQWRKDTVPVSDSLSITGSNTPTLTIHPLVAGDAGNYDVVVSNSVNPPATSNAVALTVTPPAPITGTVAWNFGTGAGVATPSSTPADVTGGEVSHGNSTGAPALLSTTSASGTYAGASGQFNAGVAARTGALSTAAGGSAYFEFPITPADNKELTVSSITFGSRSTGTGPVAWTLFSSLDGFTAPLATGTLLANSTWALNTATLSGVITGVGTDVVFRLYGSGGAGNPAAGTVNWRIDDLKVTGTTVIGVPVPPVVTSVAPANGAAGVLPSAPVTVSFSRSVVAGSGAFTLTGSLSGVHAITISGGPKVYTLTPTTPFDLGETVTLTVAAASVTNLSGTAHLAADFTSSFTTLSPVPVPIHTVQGSGLTSSFAGQTLVVQGIVVASFQGTNGVGGYYVETPQEEWDADPATSEGILVFDNTNPVAVGDKVYVAGTVVEFGSGAATETELSPVYIFNKLSANNPLPPAVEVTLPFPATGYAERYEGMLVTLPQTLTVTDNFDLGHFGEIILSNGRLPQPTNIVAPGAPAQAQLAANLLNQVMLDDGISPAYPDPTPYLNSADPATATRRTGSTAAGVTGVFGHKFGAYVIEPTAPVAFVEANPRTATAPAAGPGLRVAIGNVLNFFNGDGAGGGFPTDRGADTFAEYQAQRAKIVAGILALAPDIMGLTEVENDRVTNGQTDSYGPASAIADLVNGLNAGAPAGTTYAYVNAAAAEAEHNLPSDVIHCAFIYRVETVGLVGAPKVLDHPSFTGVNIGIARNPLAQTFQQLSNGEKFTASINHFKSKGSATADAGGGGAAANADSGDGQGSSNHVRKLQAQALVDWLATDPTGSGDPDFLIIGDLNAYAKEDPIAIIENAGYINLTEAAEGPGGYSYLFDGAFGHLDHALANDHLAGQVVDAATWHVNSDEPVYYDYNAENKSAAQQAINAGTPYRYSDHDPVVVRLNLQPDPVAPVITTPPSAQTVTVGNSVTFSVVATGIPAPTYQWRRNGVAIAGATGPSYTIANPTTVDAGSYDVEVTNSAGSVISAAGVLTVNAAAGSVGLSGLTHVYDGQPHPAVATTTPAGLPVTFTYGGSATTPTAPGWYDVVATINSPDYTGSATGLLFIDVTAVVRHLPTLDGKVRGSVHLVTAENVTLNGNGWITGDLLVPGSPAIRLNGSPAYGGTLEGTGVATPTSATITLNGGARLQHVVRRTPVQALAPVPLPPAPTGTRNVSLNTAGQNPGDFATIRNLTLNGNAGQLTLPAGTYGALTANGSSSFVLGTAGATTPAVYNLQSLTLNGSSRLVIAGPVILNLASGTALNGSVGAAGHPDWLEINIASGGLTLNGSVTVTAFVTVPSGTVTINGSCLLTGRIVADRLTVNGSGVLADPEF